MTPPRKRKLLIVNPNTNAILTGWIATEARRVADNKWSVVAVNADSGLAAIQAPSDIAKAGTTVVAAIMSHPDADGAIVSAFGDPGLDEARASCLVPTVGLGESGLLEAAENGRRFAIVTVGTELEATIRQKVADLGLNGQLAAIRFLPFSIPELIEGRAAKIAVIAAEVKACLECHKANAVLLGGAPFAGMGLSLTRLTRGIVLDGVEASVKRVERLTRIAASLRKF
jgi:allantoin racemase